MNFFQSFYLTHFSAPADERSLYRHIKTARPTTIVECAIQRGERMLKMLQLAQSVYVKTDADPASESSGAAKNADFLYVCMDPFEGRTEEDGPGLSLRKAHKLLSRLTLRHRCIPAPAEQGVAQLSRTFKDVDMLVLATPRYDWLAGKGALLASILHEDATVFLKFPEKPFQSFNLPRFRQLIDKVKGASRN